jgi:hypothetical protein
MVISVVEMPLVASLVAETETGEETSVDSFPTMIGRVMVVAGVAESERMIEVVPAATPIRDRLLLEIRAKASVESGAV